MALLDLDGAWSGTCDASSECKQIKSFRYYTLRINKYKYVINRSISRFITIWFSLADNDLHIEWAECCWGSCFFSFFSDCCGRASIDGWFVVTTRNDERTLQRHLSHYTFIQFMNLIDAAAYVGCRWLSVWRGSLVDAWIHTHSLEHSQPIN